MLVHFHVLEDCLREDSDKLPVKTQINSLYIACTVTYECHIGSKLEEWIACARIEESWWRVMCMREKCVYIHPDRPTCTRGNTLGDRDCVTSPAQKAKLAKLK